MTITYPRIQVIALTLVTAFVVGCHSDTKPVASMNDGFRPDDERRAVNDIFSQQIANGARDDGQLYQAHFDGGELNSLGKQKLDAMLYGPHQGKIVVYLDVPKDNAYATRESAVSSYFSNRGLASDAFTVNAGPNTGEGTPAVQGLRGLSRQSSLDPSAPTPPANLPGVTSN